MFLSSRGRELKESQLVLRSLIFQSDPHVDHGYDYNGR